jgi:hypothetical protein
MWNKTVNSCECSVVCWVYWLDNQCERQEAGRTHLFQSSESACLTDHSIELGHYINFKENSALDRTLGYMHHVVEEPQLVILQLYSSTLKPKCRVSQMQEGDHMNSFLVTSKLRNIELDHFWDGWVTPCLCPLFPFW